MPGDMGYAGPYGKGTVGAAVEENYDKSMKATTTQNRTKPKRKLGKRGKGYSTGGTASGAGAG